LNLVALAVGQVPPGQLAGMVTCHGSPHSVVTSYLHARLPVGLMDVTLPISRMVGLGDSAGAEATGRPFCAPDAALVQPDSSMPTAANATAQTQTLIRFKVAPSWGLAAQ
jgi:hypothetical protein